MPVPCHQRVSSISQDVPRLHNAASLYIAERVCTRQCWRDDSLNANATQKTASHIVDMKTMCDVPRPGIATDAVSACPEEDKCSARPSEIDL